jgi:hypothetical protein
MDSSALTSPRRTYITTVPYADVSARKANYHGVGGKEDSANIEPDPRHLHSSAKQTAETKRTGNARMTSIASDTLTTGDRVSVTFCL